MLQFDESKFKVIFNEIEVELQPLNYRLLKVLAAKTNKVVSVDEIFSFVWENRNVSPETLKQRVFLLRKALLHAGIVDIELKAIRGEGYMLAVPKEKDDALCTSPRNSRSFLERNIFHNFNPKRMSLFGSVLILFVVLLLSRNLVGQLHSNNRLVIWYENSESQDIGLLRQVKLNLINEIQSLSEPGIQILLSDYEEGKPIPEQARRGRVGLIVILESLEDNAVTARIVEPKTATVLASYVLELSDDISLNGGQSELLTGLENVFQSNKLALTKDMLVDSSHPIWQELSELAASGKPPN